MKFYNALLLVLSLTPSWSFQPPTTPSTWLGARSIHGHGHQKSLSTPLDNNNPLSSLKQRASSATSATSSSSSSSTSLSATTTAAAALSAIGSPIGSIAVLAFVILVHEAGHFLAARSLGINVQEFSVGVGPRIIGMRRIKKEEDALEWQWITEAELEEEDETENRNNFLEDGNTFKDEIEFSLRALPLGGYVRFPENYNRTLAFEMEDTIRLAKNEALKLRLEGSGKVEQVLEKVAARSFVANLLSLGLLRKWVDGRVERQLKELEKEVLLLEQQQKKYGRNGNNGVGAWWSNLPWSSKNVIDNNDDDTLDGKDDAKSKLQILQTAQSTPEITYYTDPNLLQNRSWQERALVLSGGVIFNILLAFACYFGELTAGRGLPKPVFENGAVVSSLVGPESPAFGVLERGDVIVGVNDVATSAITGKQGVRASQNEISNVISTIRDTPEGETVKLTILHGREDATNAKQVTVSPKRRLDALGQPTGPQSIGVMLSPNYLRTDMIKATNIVDASTKSASAVYEITSETAKAIFGLLFDLVFGKGLPAGTSMSGPIGVISSGSEVVSSRDFAAIVAFAASISVNLAVVNSLPLPALDGGQLLFVLAEAAAGRKIDQRLQEGINAGALLILLCISFGTAVGDVTSIFSR